MNPVSTSYFMFHAVLLMVCDGGSFPIVEVANEQDIPRALVK